MRYLFVLMAALVAVAVLRSQSGQPVNWKIGVVDLKKVSERFKKWQRYSLKFEGFKKSRLKYLQDKRRKLEDDLLELSDKLRILEPGSDRYYELLDKKRRMEFDLRMEEERVYRTIKAEAEKMAKELIKEIEEAISEYARQHNFALILRKDYVKLEHLSWVELQGYYTRRLVLYHGGAMDVTDEIVKILNRKVNKEK